jgi:hypothetical protein
MIMLKLVSEVGGEAPANTSWSVITPGGDVIKESTGAFPRVVLAEGDYRAIARSDGRTYERNFKVITGVDGEVEVLRGRGVLAPAAQCQRSPAVVGSCEPWQLGSALSGQSISPIEVYGS